eukprot:gene23228-28214_t
MSDKLYYSPVANFGAATFMAAYIGGVDMACEVVDVLEKKTTSGQDYTRISKKGILPSIQTGKGDLITEEPVLLEYIAEKTPKCIMPVAKSRARYTMLQLIEFISKNIMGPLTYISNPQLGEEIKVHYRTLVTEGLAYVDDMFNDYRKFANGGKKFTIADCYLIATLDTVEASGIDLNQYPHVKEYYERMCQIDYVSAAKTKMLTNPRRTSGMTAACC